MGRARWGVVKEGAWGWRARARRADGGRGERHGAIPQAVAGLSAAEAADRIPATRNLVVAEVGETAEAFTLHRARGASFGGRG
jgi:hypothetical protein